MGSSRSTPTSSTVQQVRQEYPAYFQPYLEDVLEGAQQQYQRSYEPFPESRLVETPEKRTEALTALQDMDLARMSQGVYSDAISGTQAAGTGFPDTNMEAYMNPYQQLVTDQLLRNATERRGVARKGIGDAAARAGAYGGSRQGVTEAMFDRDTQRELTDLDERSSMAAFQNALSASQADKQRQLASSAQLGQLGQAQQQALTTGIAGVEKAATAEQALAQQGRDVALQDFMSQEGFDKQKLSEYSSIIRGATPPANQFIDKTTSTPQSGLQQLGGIASLGAGLFGMGKAKGGPVEYAHGGDITQDVVTDAIDKLADIGMGKITMPTPGMDALRAFLPPAPTPQEEEIEVTENVDVMGIDGTTGLPSLGQPPVDDDFDPNSAVEVTTEERMTANRGGPVGLAYGGVPGQPYTEDIGMVGGLAAVAGPQMRFNEGKGVPFVNPYYLKSSKLENFADPKKKREELLNTIRRSEIVNKEGTETFNPERQQLETEALARLQGAPPINPSKYASDLYTAFGETKPGEEIKVTETEVDGSPPSISDGYLISEAMEGPDSWREIIEGGDDPKGPYGPAKESGNALKKEVEDLGFKLPLTNTQLISMGLALMSGREEGLATAAKVIASQKSADELDAIIKKAQMENKAKLAEHLRKARKDRIAAWNDAKGSAMKQADLIQKVRSQSVDQAIKTINLIPETQKMALFNQVGADGEELTPSERSKLAIKKIKAMVQATAKDIQSGE